MRVKQAGLTMVELMATLTIAAILLAIAVPSFRGIMQNSARTNALSDVTTLLTRGRSEATTRNVPVTACVSSDQIACSTAVNTWESGWILFIDDGKGSGGVRGNSVRDGDEELVAVHGALDRDSTLRTSGFPSARAVRFEANGTLQSAGTFVYCDTRGYESLQALNVAVVGQVRVAADADNNGQLESSSGANIAACE
jgi:type IV fimbrial biogenesis protein FimT